MQFSLVNVNLNNDAFIWLWTVRGGAPIGSKENNLLLPNERIQEIHFLTDETGCLIYTTCHRLTYKCTWKLGEQKKP